MQTSRVGRDQFECLQAWTGSGIRWTRCATGHYLEELWLTGRAPWKVWP